MSDRQLALDLPTPPSYAAEDFLVAASNRKAWALIEAWPNWPDRVLTILGPAGSGKTHLASIWAQRAGAAVLPAGALRLGGAELLRQCAAAAVEDADREDYEEAELFHMLNRARAERGYLVLTGRRSLDHWGIDLPDLASRLRLAPCVRLDEPDDELMRAVLVKLFADRQLIVDAPVVDFLALRLDRSFDAARRVVEQLDREALERSRRVTRPLAADVLAKLTAREEREPDRASPSAPKGADSW